MNFGSEYKKEVDKLCSDSIDTTADEIMKLAKERTSGQNITVKKKPKITFITKTIAAAAACLVVSGTAVYAMESGSLSNMFRNLFHDEISAELVEEGHHQQLDQTVEQNGCTVTFYGITGDRSQLKVLMDIRIPESEINNRTNKLGVMALFMPEEQHKGDLTDAGHFYAEAKADSEDPHLYRVELPVHPDFYPNDDGVFCDEFILDVRILERFEGYRYLDDLHYQDLYIKVKVPQEIFDDAIYKFPNVAFTIDGVRYNLNCAIYGAYDTDLQFKFKVGGTKYDAPYSSSDDFYHAVNPDWFRLASGAVLNVDGEEYRIIDGEDQNFACGIPPFTDCDPDAFMLFPHIDYKSAQIITLTIDGQTATLKYAPSIVNSTEKRQTNIN